MAYRLMNAIAVLHPTPEYSCRSAVTAYVEIGYRHTLNIKDRNISPLGRLELTSCNITSISHPAVSRSAATRLIHCYRAVAAIVPEVISSADFDAVRETVDEGFCYAFAAVGGEWVGEVAILGELESCMFGYVA